MKRGDQVWWRQWQGTVVGYEPGVNHSVHVDLHTHKTDKGHVERDRYFGVDELTSMPPPGVDRVPRPPIPDHPLRQHLVDEAPVAK